MMTHHAACAQCGERTQTAATLIYDSGRYVRLCVKTDDCRARWWAHFAYHLELSTA